MKRTLLTVLFAALLVGGSGHALSADSDWQLISVDNRDYVSLGNIARFYQLHMEQDPGDKRWVLGDSRPRLETTRNPRELYINGIKQWLAFPTVVQNDETFISRLDLAKTVEPSLRPNMVGNLRAFHTVVLDAGHGGQDGGSQSVTGQEKIYTLDVIKDLQRSLEAKGLKVELTRENDVYLPLEARADLANHAADAVFVSVHFNASADASAKGFEVYAMTPAGAASTSDANMIPDQVRPMPGNDFDSASLALAACVQHSVLGHLAECDRGIRRARFAVLRLTHAPAILVEGGFLSNATESSEINDPVWREKLADAIAIGVQSFQNVAAYKELPKLVADYRSELLPGTANVVNASALAVNSSMSKMHANNPMP